VKDIGKPCAGKPHARFDEGELVTKKPALYSTHSAFYTTVSKTVKALEKRNLYSKT